MTVAGAFALGLTSLGIQLAGPTVAAVSQVRGQVTGTPTLEMRTVMLSKEDADSHQRLSGWELIAYRGSGCQGHPVNDAFTAADPVPLQLVAGQYSFLETMRAGWTNVTPLCQNVDLTAADGALVFRNRREGTPTPQPDLVVDSITDAQQPFDCVRPAGLKVVVRNAGGGQAAASTTRVSVGGAAELLSTQALAAGESVSLYSTLTGIPLGDMYTAVADYNHDVVEANEANNSLTKSIALATLPTCTSTPGMTATPTNTPTPGPEMNVVRLSKEDADTGQRLTGWELIAYRGPSCQGHPVNDAFTAAGPVELSLAAGQYSFLETMQPGWTNVTPLCQPVDLTSGDGTLVFRNRRTAPLGDADCDQRVTSIDAVLVLQFNASLITALRCQMQADVNHDASVNTIDAVLILQDVAGLISL